MFLNFKDFKTGVEHEKKQNKTEVFVGSDGFAAASSQFNIIPH